MFLMPKGKPFAENVPIAKLQLPDALDKLKDSKLTGCATFNFTSADCALIYEDGKLISALLNREDTEQKDADALRALVDLMVLTNSGSFNVYGFSRGANQAVLAMMCGDKIIHHQELKQIDFKALLERIKNERMTATLKISADRRVGMILYSDGANVGFFHDTADSIETTAGKVQQIAELPGATVDLIALKGSEKLSLDLSEVVDIRSLWKTAKGDVFATSNLHHHTVTSVQMPPIEANSADIETAIIEIANSSLGKLGKTLAVKELLSVGGIKALKEKTKLIYFLNAMEKSSILLTSAGNIKNMCDAISSEAAKL